MKILAALFLVIALAGCSGSRQTKQQPEEFFRPLSSAEIQKLRHKGKSEKPARTEQSRVLAEKPRTKAETDSLRAVISNLEKGLLIAQKDNFELRLKIANAALESASGPNKNLADRVERLPQKFEPKDRPTSANGESAGPKDGESALGMQPRGSVASTYISKQLITPSAQYQQALDLFNRRQYANSIQILDRVQNLTTDKDLSTRSKYWMGENYFGLGDYTRAMKHFEMVEASGHLGKQVDACWMLARCHENLREFALAQRCFERIVKEFSSNRLARAAKKRLESPQYQIPTQRSSSRTRTA